MVKLSNTKEYWRTEETYMAHFSMMGRLPVKPNCGSALVRKNTVGTTPAKPQEEITQVKKIYNKKPIKNVW